MRRSQSRRKRGQKEQLLVMPKISKTAKATFEDWNIPEEFLLGKTGSGKGGSITKKDVHHILEEFQNQQVTSSSEEEE